MKNLKRYILNGILVLVFLIHATPSNSHTVGLDNTAIPPSIRFFKQNKGLVFGVSYASGGNPGYYDAEGNSVLEQTLDFDANPDLSFFTEDGIKLLRDTMDKVDRLWDTDYTDISFNAAYLLGDFLLFGRATYQIRDYNLRYAAVQYDPAFQDRLIVGRKVDIEIPVESDTRFSQAKFGFRYPILNSDKYKLYIKPEYSLSLIDRNARFFGNTPSELYIPLGAVAEFESFGFQLETGYNVRDRGTSNQFLLDGSLFLTNVETALLFVDFRYLQSLETVESFEQFQSPIAPTYLTVAPGFDITINGNLNFNFRYMVDLYNKSNYGMSRFSIGANYIFDGE